MEVHDEEVLMSQFKSQLLGLIKEEVSNNVTIGLATVTSYNSDHNFVDARFQHPNGKEIELTNIPMKLAEGLSTPHISSGMSVVLLFPNGSTLTAIAIAIIDMNYRFDTKAKSRHKRKGSYIPNQISARGTF